MKCPQCMQNWDAVACQACHYRPGDAPRVAAAMPRDSLLQGRYRLGNALGENRQAILYIAWDEQAGKPVFATEFFPKSNAQRREDGLVSSKRSGPLFRQAVTLFAQNAGNNNASTSVLDAFEFNGTAWRIHRVKEISDLNPQAEDILDKPLLFRNQDGKPLMTINALPLPELPSARAFQASGSLQRRQKGRVLRRLGLLATGLLVVLAAVLLIVSSNKKVPVSLSLGLYQGQSIWLGGKGLTEQEVANYQSAQAVPGDVENQRLASWQGSLVPGNYTLSLRQDHVGEQQIEAFEVKKGQEVRHQAQAPLPPFTVGRSGGEADLAIAKLKELGYLDPAQTYPAFDEAAAKAYAAFARDFQVPFAEGQATWTPDQLQALQNAQVTPTPVPLPVTLPQDHFVYGLGESPTLMMAGPDHPGSEAPMGYAPKLRKVFIDLGTPGESLSSLVLNLHGTTSSLDLSPEDLKNAGNILWLEESLVMDAQALIHSRTTPILSHSFPHLEPPFILQGEAMNATFIIDAPAVEDFMAFGALPVAEGSTGYTLDGELHLDPPPEEASLQALQALYAEDNRLQTDQPGRASQPLRFYQLSWSQEDPYASLYQGEAPLLGLLSFSLPPLSGEFPLGDLSRFTLTPGDYVLSLHSENPKIQALLPSVPFTVKAEDLALSIPFDPESLRDYFDISLYSLGGGYNLLGDYSGLPTSLYEALLTPGQALSPVNVVKSLPEGIIEGFWGRVVVVNLDNRPLSFPVGDILGLPPGTYTLKLGSHVSLPLTLNGQTEESTFTFDAQTRELLIHQAVDALTPLAMLVLDGDRENPQLLLRQAFNAVPGPELRARVFQAKKDSFQQVQLQVQPAQGLQTSPAASLKISGFSHLAGDNSLAFPLGQGHRISLALYLAPEVDTSTLVLEPLGADRVSAHARVLLLEDVWKQQSLDVFLLDYVWAYPESIPGGTVVEIFPKTVDRFQREKSRVMASVRFQGIPEEALDLSRWLALPAGSYWLVPDGMPPAGMKITPDGTVIVNNHKVPSSPGP